MLFNFISEELFKLEIGSVDEARKKRGTGIDCTLLDCSLTFTTVYNLV